MINSMENRNLHNIILCFNISRKVTNRNYVDGTANCTQELFLSCVYINDKKYFFDHTINVFSSVKERLLHSVPKNAE